MLHLFYNISIAAYIALIRLAAPFNAKAGSWLSGRRGWKGKLKAWRENNPGRLWWIHCASLGEFEQGRPVLEALKQRHPDWKVVLTFFSPSGYEVRKNYSGADLVIYLPADTPAQSRAFVELLDPGFVVFVKYEYWANYFFSCQRKGIPIFMASAILRPGQRFFGVFSRFWKKVLACVDRFFVQDKRTMELLADLGFNNTVLCGDTRFDRVVEVKRTAKPDVGVSQFVGERICIVAGSTWPADDKLLTQWLSQKKKSGLDYRMILVPHEIGHFDHEALDGTGLTLVRWSQRTNDTWENADILLVDVMGQLSSLYRFGRLAYIGGGFGKGI
ncbi:MAG: 3-deoxy-D-manno-octulosonic acid transferase, partial [Flavobacteriales bacterium]|nr:3-deoxy-D-manno-octulosonic acid transferase [Flavobacteriales bacterium]